MLVVLTATMFLTSVLQQLYTAAERERSLEHRLETLASSLLASGLSLNLIENMDSTDDLVSDLLGEERADLIINVYATDGEILAQNMTGSLIPLDFYSEDGFKTVEVDGRRYRVLTITQKGLVIQVGTVLYPSLIREEFFLNGRFAAFLGTIFLLLIGSSYVGSRILFSPLTRLSQEFEAMSRGLGHKLGQPLSEFVIGMEFSRLSRGKKLPNDEFGELCRQIEAFLEKLGEYTSSFNAQTAVLTHELKTPLTILRNDLDILKRSADDPKRAREIAQACVAEIDRLSVLINGFLQWSVLASNPSAPNEVHAVKLGEIVTKIATGMNSVHANRIALAIEGTATIFALPYHVEQLVTNLLANAINYSPGTVECNVSGSKLTILDHGSGIPKMVLDHIGRPFNRGISKSTEPRGSGLGLAWVHALCERYGWKLSVDSSETGTKIEVIFP